MKWCYNRVLLSSTPLVRLALVILGRGGRRAVHRPSLWMCLLRLLKQQQSELLAQRLVHFSLLFYLCSPLSVSHFFSYPTTFSSFLSSCRRGKPLTSWPGSLSASQLARGPCQSSSSSSHAVFPLHKCHNVPANQ